MSMRIQSRKSQLTTNKNRVGYVFILPCLVGLLFFFFPSLIESMVYSFQNITIGFNTLTREPAGFANYLRAFQTDITYRTVLINAIRGMVVDTLTIMVFSFLWRRFSIKNSSDGASYV